MISNNSSDSSPPMHNEDLKDLNKMIIKLEIEKNKQEKKSRGLKWVTGIFSLVILITLFQYHYRYISAYDAGYHYTHHKDYYSFHLHFGFHSDGEFHYSDNGYPDSFAGYWFHTDYNYNSHKNNTFDSNKNFPNYYAHSHTDITIDDDIEG